MPTREAVGEGRAISHIPYTPRVPAANAIELLEVSKLYGTFAALRKVTVDFHTAKSYVILGPNGAGKSTLLRNLAGLTRPSFGKMTILGSAEVSEVRSRIGYLGHDSMLYDELTAMENLRYSASLYQDETLPGGRWSPEESLTLVGLDPGLDRPVGKFSQGMRQRASLARVLMAKPDLLLLDEPFSNVDLASSAQMLHVLDQLRTAGNTILLTTHQPDLARPIADCFCTMEAGQIASMEYFAPSAASAANLSAEEPRA
ncbi:MAG: ABC transporter ATP-binding protein [Acidobacteriaceae bacterium]